MRKVLIATMIVVLAGCGGGYDATPTEGPTDPKSRDVDDKPECFTIEEWEEGFWSNPTEVLGTYCKTSDPK